MATTPAPGARKPVRRRLIVDGSFQLRALLPLVVFVVVYAALIAGLAFVPLHRKVNAEPDPGVRAILRAQLDNLHWNFWPLLGTAGLLAAYVGLHWSLRVAGPLYRLHRSLSEMAEGEAKPVRFRRGDECKIFEEDVAQLDRKMKLIATRNRDILLGVHGQVKRLADRVAAGEIIARADLEDWVKSALAQLEKAPEIGLPTRR